MALVLRAELAGAVRLLGGLGHLDERDLADLHRVVDRDREVGDVRELQRHVPVPTGVDESGGRVDQEPEPAERRLPVEARDEVVGEAHTLERRAEHELARVEDERGLVVDLDELGQVLLGLARTGKLITSAALVLMFAFFVLSSSPGTDIKQFGIGLAAGIIFDATVIRTLLVPSLVRMFGRWNWWLPTPVARVLRVPPAPLRPAGAAAAGGR